MEDALRATNDLGSVSAYYVLILVLMEDALRGRRDPQQRHPRTVLILVLMEDALRGPEQKDFENNRIKS